MHTAAVYASDSFMPPLPGAPHWGAAVWERAERKGRTVPVRCVSERLGESCATGEAAATLGLGRSYCVELTRLARHLLRLAQGDAARGSGEPTWRLHYLHDAAVPPVPSPHGSLERRVVLDPSPGQEATPTHTCATNVAERA